VLLIKLMCFDLKIIAREQKLSISIVAIPLLVVGTNVIFRKVANFAFESGLPFVFMATLIYGIIFQALYTGHGLRMNTMLLFPLSSIQIVTVKNFSAICVLVLCNLWVSAFTWWYFRPTTDNTLSSLLFSIYLPMIVIEVWNLLGFWIGNPSRHAGLWLLLVAMLLSTASGIFFLCQRWGFGPVVALTGTTVCAFWLSLRFWASMFRKKKFWLLQEAESGE